MFNHWGYKAEKMGGMQLAKHVFFTFRKRTGTFPWNCSIQIFSKILIFKGRIIYILTNFVKKIFPKRNFPKLSFLIEAWLGNSEISLEMLKLGKLVLEFSFYEISSQMILPWTLFEPKIHLPKIELFADFRDLWQGRLLSLQTYKTWHICKSLYYCLLHIEAAMNKSEQRESLKKGNAM